MTMIRASIYRTEKAQVEEKGAIAWDRMNFNASHTSVEVVRDYCEQLAREDGIINPHIVIRTVED